MSYRGNIGAFLLVASPNHLLDSYRILVAVELSLKDGGFTPVQSGHDVPSMLTQAAQRAGAGGHHILAGQIAAEEAKLRTDLAKLRCTNPNGTTRGVPDYNYPYVRYTRFAGDWGGVDETGPQALSDLSQRCNSLASLLRAHQAELGIQI